MRYTKWLALILIAAVLFAAVGCNIRIISGSKTVEIRDFTFSDFTAVQAGSAFKLEISRGDSFKVQVSANANLWDHLDINQTGSTIHFSAKPGVIFHDATFKATITMPAIASLDLSGASMATVTNFSSEGNMAFTESGASEINVFNMKSGTTTFSLSGASTVSGGVIITDGKFNLSGASRVNLNGSGASAAIHASGASRVTIDQLKVQSVNVNLSGASEAKVNCQNIASADLSGASRLYYVDSPTINKINTSGGSSLSQE